ncbi:anti-sigma regulatory factor [Myxococcus sp. RHSTA-1-4]|uniref:anti-sigma regulatory factor n=1 Tax=Myxococcus sp. RHSTA-1-4 TaxID=2874601 RepID=UPI001CBE37C4|nr:anti-sigma regulatory factor [Myxococcus sp. RHSTA-1-4]MBZ4420211.1 anti-sigma regulatory factor [Myxococcus sp. RHSTA-1-4]
MTVRVLSHQEMNIDNEDDVVLVRRAVRTLAEARGFDSFAVSALTTAATELSRNVWVHARKGKAFIEEVTDGDRTGIQVEFVDQGPGIPDIEWSMAGGHSTAKSLGLGLSGSKRLVDAFHIESEPGKGTRVRITKWKRF